MVQDICNKKESCSCKEIKRDESYLASSFCSSIARSWLSKAKKISRSLNMVFRVVEMFRRQSHFQAGILPDRQDPSSFASARKMQQRQEVLLHLHCQSHHQ